MKEYINFLTWLKSTKGIELLEDKELNCLVYDSRSLLEEEAYHGRLSMFYCDRLRFLGKLELTFPEFHFETEAKVDFPSACI